MFTLKLENSKIANSMYSYILEHFDLTDIEVKQYSEKLVFKFDNNDKLYKSFSLSFTNLIIHFFEKKTIQKILRKNYFYFSDEEQFQILSICDSILNDEEANHKNDLIFLAVFDYIKNNSFMNLVGFLQFRLKDYLEILDYLVDLAVNNFIINREYTKFIELLQEYITSSSPKIDIIHLIYLNQESILLDESKNLIPIDDQIMDAKYLSDISFSTNDYSLNTLLNLLPEKLYIHILDEEDEFINTLEKIFKSRIVFCYDCEICNFYKTTTSLVHSDKTD